MDWIDNFTAIIQLMCAVNFGFIATSYNEKVYDMFFKHTLLVDRPYRKIVDINRLLVNSEISKEMVPKDSSYGITNEEIEEVKKASEELNEAREKWNKESCNLKEKINKEKNINGAGNFFLFISIYGVIEMILIALIQSSKYSFFLIFLAILNTAVFIYSLGIAWLIRSHKMDERSTYSCFIGMISVYVCVIMATIIFTFIYLFFFEHTSYFSLPPMLINVCLSEGVILPFFPLFFLTLHIWLFSQKISKKVSEIVSEVKLNEKEEKLDEIKKGLEKKLTFTNVSSI